MNATLPVKIYLEDMDKIGRHEITKMQRGNDIVHKAQFFVYSRFLWLHWVVRAFISYLHGTDGSDELT